jgi:tetratricopeptide (TPR) repeat protein
MKLITGLMVIFLAGCAGIHEKKVDDSVSMADEIVDTEVVEKDITVEEDEVTAISSEVLFLLMTAEIAGQRKKYDVALEGYLQAAKHVEDPEIAKRAARIGLFLKDTKKTDEAVSLWLKNDKNNLTARKMAILSSMRGLDKDNAVKHLNGMLKDDPAGFESTLMDVTQVLAKDGNSEFAYEVVDELATQHPDQAVVFFVQALLAGQLNKQDIGMKKVDAALALQPDWDKALVLRAQFFMEKNKYALARQDLEQILEKTPDNVQMQKMLAHVLIKEKNFEGALAIYQQILKDNEGDGDAQFSKALVYLQQEKDDEAVEVFEGLINKPEWDAAASFYLGRVEYQHENYKKALVWFDKVTSGSYEYDASMLAISVLLNQKDYLEAKKRIEQVAEKFPTQKVRVVLLKAEIHSLQKEHQKAFDVLSDALKESPSDRDFLYTRALVAEKLGRLDVLEKDLKQVIEKKPDDVNALNALGYTLADRTTRYEDAEMYLQQAIKLQPNEAVIVDSLGWLRFKQGRLSDALGYLKGAYARNAQSEIAAHLVEVLWVMGRKKEAREIFDKAYKKSPNDEFLGKVQGIFSDVKK